jgi:hypothetical protein
MAHTVIPYHVEKWVPHSVLLEVKIEDSGSTVLTHSRSVYACTQRGANRDLGESIRSRQVVC